MASIDPHAPSPLVGSVSRRSVSAQVADVLRDMIFTGQLRAGEAVKQDRVGRMLDVSHMPVREALQRLAHEGFLEGRENRSYVVREITRQDVRDVYWMHAVLSGELAARACEAATSDLVDELDALNRETSHGATHTTCWAFHDALNSAAAAPKIVSELERVTRFVPEHYYLRSDLWQRQTHRAHRAIARAVRNREPDTVRSIMQDHVQSAADFLIENFTDRGHWKQPTSGPLPLRLDQPR